MCWALPFSLKGQCNIRTWFYNEFFSQISFVSISYLFLDASSHLYKRVCLSVRPSVGPSVRLSIRYAFSKIAKIAEIRHNALIWFRGLSLPHPAPGLYLIEKIDFFKCWPDMVFHVERFDWRQSPKNRARKHESCRILSPISYWWFLASHVNPMGANLTHVCLKVKKS